MRQSSSCINLCAAAEDAPGAGTGDLDAPPLAPDHRKIILAMNLRGTVLAILKAGWIGYDSVGHRLSPYRL